MPKNKKIEKQVKKAGIGVRFKILTSKKRNLSNSAELLEVKKPRFSSSESIVSFNDYNVNKKNNFGLTPLHLAVNGSNEELIREYLKEGANPNITDNSGNTAFHFAAANNNWRIFQLLMGETHTDYENIIDNNDYGKSILLVAVNACHEIENFDWKFIENLLNLGIKSEIADSEDIKDIFRAKDYSYVEKYEELLEKNEEREIIKEEKKNSLLKFEIISK